jgi:hypothetical protein
VTKKFDITGRKTAQAAPSSPERAQDMEHFITGAEPITTMTVQIPERLKRALKQQALDRNTTVKNLLIEILGTHFADEQAIKV